MELNFLFLDFYILSMSITNMITVIKNIKQFQIFIRYDTFGFRKLYINNSVDSVICQLPVFYRNQIKQIFVNKLYNFNGRYFFIYHFLLWIIPNLYINILIHRFLYDNNFAANTNIVCIQTFDFYIIIVIFLARNTQQKSEQLYPKNKG